MIFEIAHIVNAAPFSLGFTNKKDSFHSRTNPFFIHQSNSTSGLSSAGVCHSMPCFVRSSLCLSPQMEWQSPICATSLYASLGLSFSSVLARIILSFSTGFSIWKPSSSYIPSLSSTIAV